MVTKKILVFLVLASALISVVFISGCASSGPKNLTSILVNGQPYQFVTNLYDAIKIPVNDEAGIKRMFDSSDRVCIVFDESNETDNSYFTVVAYNTVYKVTRYYSSFDKSIGFTVCNGLNLTDMNTTTLTLKGPGTGATENSVTLNGTNIIVQGTNSTGIQMAGEKLVLIVFGVDTLPSQE